MKRYKQAKRGTYKARTRKIYTYDICDGQDRDKRTRIHIPIRYDGYKRTIYVKIIHGKTRNNRAHTYVGMTNTINELFPEINAPHNARTYRGTAPTRKYAPPEYTRTRVKHTFSDTETHRDTRRVKCILLYTDGTIAHMGIFRRTRITRTSNTRIETEIYLHRNDRKLQVYEGIPPTKIHGMTPTEIRAHDVEIYYI